MVYKRKLHKHKIRKISDRSFGITTPPDIVNDFRNKPLQVIPTGTEIKFMPSSSIDGVYIRGLGSVSGLTISGAVAQNFSGVYFGFENYGTHFVAQSGTSHVKDERTKGKKMLDSLKRVW